MVSMAIPAIIGSFNQGDGTHSVVANATGISDLQVSILEIDFVADILIGMDMIRVTHFTIYNQNHYTICI